MKKSFQTEMDDTQQAVSQIVCLCTTIALHQEFGVGKTRLDRITDRIHELEDQNTEVIMTPDADGRPSKARAEAIRESWLAGYVTSDYRIPMLRAPRGRKEQQYQIAGNKAARIAWQIYAKAVIDRCAADAMQAPDLEVTDIDGSKDAAEVDKEFRKQQLNFIKRVRAQTLGRIGATAQPVNVLADQSMQDKIQLVMQQVSQQSFERRRTH